MWLPETTMIQVEKGLMEQIKMYIVIIVVFISVLFAFGFSSFLNRRQMSGQQPYNEIRSRSFVLSMFFSLLTAIFSAILSIILLFGSDKLFETLFIDSKWAVGLVLLYMALGSFQQVYLLIRARRGLPYF
jgi:hypothetical protein